MSHGTSIRRCISEIKLILKAFLSKCKQFNLIELLLQAIRFHNKVIHEKKKNAGFVAAVCLILFQVMLQWAARFMMHGPAAPSFGVCADSQENGLSIGESVSCRIVNKSPNHHHDSSFSIIILISSPVMLEQVCHHVISV